MKTKHYIYIAIGLLLAVVIGIPTYYYCQGFFIKEKNPNPTSVMISLPGEPQPSKFKKFVTFVLQYWIFIATKNPHYILYKQEIPNTSPGVKINE